MARCCLLRLWLMARKPQMQTVMQMQRMHTVGTTDEKEQWMRSDSTACPGYARYSICA